jgi:hypothetical protein
MPEERSSRSTGNNRKGEIVKMAKSFKNLRNKMLPAAKEQSTEIARELRREIRLSELRGALNISREELAKLPGKKQA